MQATDGRDAATELGSGARHLDELLEEALIGSFPASDPPAIHVEERAAPSSSDTRSSRTDRTGS
jgi:hypothetical protein